jgi:hypothetical protein
MSPTSIQNLLNDNPVSFGDAAAVATAMSGGQPHGGVQGVDDPLSGMIPPSSLPFGTVDTGGDINYSAWPFALSEVTGMDQGAVSTGAVADIWSMAPWSFEWVGVARAVLWVWADLVGCDPPTLCTGWMTGLRIYDKRSLNRRRRRSSSSRRRHLDLVGLEGVT